MSDRLAGRVALIAGAGNGMGRAAAVLMAAEGAQTVVCARSAHRLDDTAALIKAAGGLAAHSVVTDLTDPEATETLVAAIIDRFGRLDAVMVNAGTSGYIDLPLPDTPRDVDDQMIDLNVRTALTAARATLPALAERNGSLIFVAAAPKTLLWPNATYAVTKGGIIELTRSLAREWWPRARVNSISPGSIRRVRIGSDVMPIDDALDRGGDHRDVMHFGGEPADIAYTALFLASPESSWVTGVDIPVDGGAHVRW